MRPAAASARCLAGGVADEEVTTAALLWLSRARSASTRPGPATARAGTDSGSARSSAAASGPPLLVPLSEGALAEAPVRHGPALVVPAPSSDRARAGERDLAAITYGANPAKKGLDRVLSAWRTARRGSETLVVAGVAGRDEDGVRYAGMLAPAEYRALLRRARVFVTAPRREDYGIAQLEALADGCALVTTASPGPYAALPVARALDPRSSATTSPPR